MFVKQLKLTNFRNYAEQVLLLEDGVNVLIGENAQGKTNALEAIYMLAMGKSHRTQKDAEVLHWGQTHGNAEALVWFGQKERKLKLEIGPKGKKAYINGVSQTKMTDFIGHFQVVLFAPEDLQLVKGSPGQRRRFIDMELGQTQPKYLYHLSQYARVLQQRNAALKSDKVDIDFIEIFDAQLIEHGVEILVRRLEFLRQLQVHATNIYGAISNHRETFSMNYVSTVPHVRMDDTLSKQEIETRYASALTQKRHADIQQRLTTVGPHRDDLAFFLQDLPVHAVASQGQQRTIALALRLAEIDFIHQNVGEYPVLLLDDVLSELDDLRQRNLVLSMSEKVQTIITTTSMFQLQNRLQGTARLFHVHSGIIEKEG